MPDITKDRMYDTVAPGDFRAMIEPARYGTRSDAFDRIISATHDHFWDPSDPRYIDFATPFDLDTELVVPEHMVPALSTKLIEERVKGRDRVRLVNETARFYLSTILHGEQGALSLSASLCHLLRDPGAQEYAANQTREEARHVQAFSRYIEVRWGTPLPAGPTVTDLLDELVHADEVYKKIVGMQMLVEGLAMGSFATLFRLSDDPLLRRLCQLVMTDEAFHHKFGKIWADRTVPKLSPAEHALVEDWALGCFQRLLNNLVSPLEMKSIYAEFGLDWREVMDAFTAAVNDEDRRKRMKESTNIFRVLIKTLLNAGIITERTHGHYAFYVDMDELRAEGEHMVGDDIAEEGIEYLRMLNFVPEGAPLLARA